MMPYEYRGSKIIQDDWDLALELAERWKEIRTTESYGNPGLNMAILARAFLHLKVCYDELVKMNADDTQPGVWRNEWNDAMEEAAAHVSCRYIGQETRYVGSESTRYYYSEKLEEMIRGLKLRDGDNDGSS